MVTGLRPIPQAARAAQARASSPSASAFVSANAGSGKTHVLVQRLIRLLLNGVPPEKILCITFTRAAAANMAGRVYSRLGHWVTLDDAALDDAIRETGVSSPTPSLRATARRLFASALETPGGLKVLTIHALCARLLQQFPFEANVPARFGVLDERDQTEMMTRATLAVLTQAAHAPQSAAGRALQTGLANASNAAFTELVREALASRDHFMAFADAAGDADTAAARLATALGVAASDRLEDTARDILEGPHLPRRAVRDVADRLATGGKADQEQAARMREALSFTGSAEVDAYLSIFLTEEKTPRKLLTTKPFAEANPDVTRRLDAEARRLVPVIERRRALVVRDRTIALIHIATAAAANYRREKAARGLLDYDDLIDRTLAMLARVSSGWVHYKLDRGVDHLLIDEAQDTSPRQWDIIAHLICEFTSGEGARAGVVRTVFAVGDEKQSIFSFQGAAPRELDSRRRSLRKRFEDAGLRFDPVAFTCSFRTGAAILKAVDHVFGEEAIFRSIHADNARPVHESLPDAGPSLIELWELSEADKRQDIEGWRAPFDGVSATSPDVKLARRIQAEIRRLVAAGTMTGHAGARRPLRYGDVLVLVRRRGATFDAVIQTLKHAGIPVAGADRLKLTEHIAIIDLMSLADALLAPRDDLALAVALKSPLFGLDDDDLFELAFARREPLRASLEAHRAGRDKLRFAFELLVQCEARFARETPFSFFAWLLGAAGGKLRFLNRLGHEAADALDELLELALGYERKAPASLQGFVAWLRAADTEVKRDMEISRDEVRVMTVHGAKGLEAPVAILVDTTSSPRQTQRLQLIDLHDRNGGKVVVWAGRKADDPAPLVKAREDMLGEMDDEYRRLLYVAMTRAADRLIVGGCQPGNRTGVVPGSWYALIEQGLARAGLHEEILETPEGKVRRFMRPEDGARMSEAAPAPGGAGPAGRTLPQWLRAAPASILRVDTPLRPSNAGHAARRKGPGRSVRSRELAILRGTLVHRLLQSLPELPATRRAEAAESFLLRNAAGFGASERSALARDVLALIGDPRFAAVFSEDSRAEVGIVGRLAAPGRPLVTGQVDRLVVRPHAVLIVDFKTSHDPPTDPAEAPEAYVRQLALYRAVLGTLYPQRTIRTALVFTETPQLMEIPPARLDAALEGLCQGRRGA